MKINPYHILEYVEYKGEKTLLVYIMRSKMTLGNNKGKKQYPIDMAYIGQPFSKIVELKELTLINL